MRSAAGLFLLSTTRCGGAVVEGPAASPKGAPMPAELWSWFDLPEADPRSRELSGITWDEAGRRLWAVPDRRNELLSLVPDAELRGWTFGDRVPIDTRETLDLEGIVLLEDGFVVVSEIGPRMLELDRSGRIRREIHFPERLAQALHNKSLESLSLSPDGRYLFTANEAALPKDGNVATASNGTNVRIVRLDRQSGEATEHAYLTDPVSRDGGDYGVADLAALSDHELLVLERGWAKGVGNSVRIYRVDLADEGSTCGTVDALAPGAPTLSKSLVVDIAKLDLSRVPPLPAPKQPQASPLLDNYEGMALGPRLKDGRRALMLISDDNGRSDQYARLLVIAMT